MVWMGYIVARGHGGGWWHGSRGHGGGGGMVAGLATGLGMAWLEYDVMQMKGSMAGMAGGVAGVLVRCGRRGGTNCVGVGV